MYGKEFINNHLSFGILIWIIKYWLNQCICYCLNGGVRNGQGNRFAYLSVVYTQIPKMTGCLSPKMRWCHFPTLNTRFTWTQ